MCVYVYVCVFVCVCGTQCAYVQRNIVKCIQQIVIYIIYNIYYIYNNNNNNIRLANSMDERKSMACRVFHRLDYTEKIYNYINVLK